VNKVFKNFIQRKSYFHSGGQVALPTILFIGGIVLELSLIGIFVALLLTKSTRKAKLSSEVWAIAKAGMEDSLLKIAEDKNFSSSYTIQVGKGVANIQIIKDSDNSSIYKIISSGKVFNLSRTLQALVTINQESGKINLKSVEEIK